ncbi:MAG: hypothetical protein H7A25_12245 [Leptospiraceae bacterium]|nr:hypothetical protein [Leptospiraceae bacterium]MCP5500670.1 hypothetical protein [Leptospiraceae bacterium]
MTDDIERKNEIIYDRMVKKLNCKHLIYGMYDYDENELIIDNLDKVAIEGKVFFYQEYNSIWDKNEEESPGLEPIKIKTGKAEIEIPMPIAKGKTFTSPVVENPNWLTIAKLADEMIQTTGDFHHVFLEGIEILEEKNSIKKARFRMGS